MASFHATLGLRAGFILPITSALGVGILSDVEGVPLRARARMDDHSVWTEPPWQVSIGIAVATTPSSLRQ